MQYRSAAAAVVAAGAVLAVPSVGFAETTTTPTAPVTTTTSGTPAPTTSKPGNYPFVAVSPAGAAKPGQEVLVSVGCPGQLRGAVRSMALDVGKFELTNEDPEIFAAQARVHADARSGWYTVTAACGDRTVKINFEVRGLAPKPTATKPPKPKTGHQVAKIPAGAPQTGGGGTAH